MTLYMKMISRKRQMTTLQIADNTANKVTGSYPIQNLMEGFTQIGLT